MANSAHVTAQEYFECCYVTDSLGLAKFEPSSLTDALENFLVLDLFCPYTSEFQTC